MRLNLYYLLKLLISIISIWLSALCAVAEEISVLTFKDLKTAYRSGEMVQIELETRVPSDSPEIGVDLWVAIQLPNKQLLFVIDEADNSVTVTPKPLKSSITLVDSIELVLQKEVADTLAGDYILYALYSEADTDFNQLLAHSHSNLAMATLTLAATIGLDSRPKNSSCIAPPRPTLAKPFPQKLSQTGCVIPDNPTQPAPGVISYTINSPLWSDAALKKRWMALPDNTQITVGEDGNWIFPIGTVLIKDFYLNDKPIETRLLVRHDDGDWAGYSYQWNYNGTDAILLETEKTKVFNGQFWDYPSREQCLECHTQAAGRVLGPETGQMNRLHTYFSNGRTASQLDTLIHIGLLEDNEQMKDQPIIPEPTDNQASLELRAKGYLHSNCSYCHRPENNPRVPHDYRFTAPLSTLCSELTFSDSESPKTQLLTAGYPEYSLISLRMHRRDKLGMPPLGTNMLDSEGMALVDDWIRSIDCF
jgi:uncharacterized repeat protein (TIGR03806 family)